MMMNNDTALILAQVNMIAQELETLRRMLQEDPSMETDEIDWNLEGRKLGNKYSDGKLTTRGEEVCYRMFDEGRSAYFVCHALRISFGAAKYRERMWMNVGGKERVRRSLD
jgi:hypothetical protein